MTTIVLKLWHITKLLSTENRNFNYILFLLIYPPSPKTPVIVGNEGMFSSGFGGFRPKHSAKDGFLRSSAKQSEGESKGTAGLPTGLHKTKK